MKIIKQRIIPPVPERAEDYIEEIKCDLCGVGKGRGSFRSEETDWSYTGWEFDKIQISRTSGESYPECGKSATESFHICPQCWQSKLKPWFESQGATSTENSSDW